MSLSSLIVQRGVATMRQLEEALARQVIYGGDLVTNLLEVARVDETLLIRLLAESMRLPAGPSGMLPEVPARVRSLIAADFATQRAVVPLEQTGERRLVLVVAEPLPHDVEKQLALSLGLTLDQRAAPLVRVLQAVARAYGVPLDRRMQRLVGRLSGEGAHRGTPLPSLLTPQPPSAAPAAPLPVAEAVTVTSAPPRSFAPDAAPGRTGTPAFGMPVERLPERVMALPLVRRKTSTSFPAARLATDALPAMAPPSMSPPVAPPPPAQVDRVSPSAPPPPRPPSVPPASRPPSVPPGRRPPSERPAGLIKRDGSTSSRAGRRRRGPLTAEAARREAEEASDRDTLLDLFFEYTRQFFDYAAVFLLHGDIAEGRDAFGDGAPRDRVLGIGVPLDLPSLLSDAKEKRLPLVAKARPDGLDAVLLGDLGRARDIEVAVVPLVVRTRAVAVLVADCGDSGVDRGSLKEAASFSSVIGAAFERIIVRRKLDGFVPGSREAAVGRVTAGLLASKRAAVPPAGFNKGLAPTTRADRAPEQVTAPPERATVPPAPSPEPSPAPAPVASPAPAAEPLPPAAPSQAAHTVDTVRPPSRRPGTLLSTLPPPASNIAASRRVSGPPIPREEPSSVSVGRVVARGAARTGPPRVRSGPPPPLKDEVSAVSDADTAQALFAELGWATTESPFSAEAETRPSGAISVPPHRPPTPVAAAPSDSLPSVIVNVDGEVRALVDRLLASGIAGYGDPADHVPPDGSNPADLAEQAERAEGELLRLGERAMHAIMERFPGPVAFTRERIAVMGSPPRASDSGPLLRLIVRERRVALPFVLERLTSADADVRGWATHLLCELPYVEAIPHLVPRLGDAEASVRASAVLALRAIGRVGPDAVRDALVELVHAVGPNERLAAIAAMARVRDASFVPELVRALGDGEDRVVEAAHEALGELTRQDFGTDARPWLKWWEQNAPRHRIEWLIDALTHDVTAFRRAAGDELRAVTREYFGYSSDLPQRDRERAQQRYRDWWLMEGRARFQG